MNDWDSDGDVAVADPEDLVTDDGEEDDDEKDEEVEETDNEDGEDEE
jgi:hypothetical protein